MIVSILEKGSLIQITDPKHHWYPAILVVDEIKSWGVIAYLTIPTNDDESNGNAYIRLETKEFERIGAKAILLVD